MSAEPVAVTILDREYLVACTPEERAGLVAAAGLVDGRMREIRQNARSAGLDRIAVLVALNLAHELLQLRQDAGRQDSALGAELVALRGRLETALGAFSAR